MLGVPPQLATHGVRGRAYSVGMATALRPWSDGDRELLHRANEPHMTEHLGGSETYDEVEQRHAKYLRFWKEGSARMFAITLDGVGVGGIGWWNSEWRDEPVHETGWFVIPEVQGRGVAAAATREIIADARDHGTLRLLTAFPSVTNPASNRLCEVSAFALDGQHEFEFRAATLTTNAWILDLDELRQKDSLNLGK